MKASRTRYSIVALAIGLAILSYVQRVAISQAAGPISHDLHLNKAQMGLVFGAFGPRSPFVLGAVLMLLSATLAQRVVRQGIPAPLPGAEPLTR